MALQNGDLLNNRYLIKQVITGKGDTVIYRAYDQNTETEVGIKECQAISPESRSNLMREYQLFAGLRHPNLMRVTDTFEIEGQAVYQVTDFVDGKKVYNPSLYPEGMPVREAVPIILAVCDVLYYLHHNLPLIVHGEVNLDTINLSPDGQVILIHPRWILEGSFGFHNLAEKPLNSPPVPRTDIDDLCLVLIQLLTGQPTEVSSTVISPNWLQEMLSQRNPPIPDGIAMVINKALNPDESQRFQHIEEFKTALLNAVIFMPPEPAGYHSQPQSPVGSGSDRKIPQEPAESSEPVSQPEPPPMAKTPIRRRVPWGLLIL